MDILEWREAYSVGVKILDEHHKKLLALIERLDYTIRHERGKGVNTILTELYSYTSYHFSEEEKLMAEYNYPEIGRHKEYHEEFKRMLNSKIEESESDLAVSLEMIQFLNNWLIDHILIQDKKYSEYIK